MYPYPSQPTGGQPAMPMPYHHYQPQEMMQQYPYYQVPEPMHHPPAQYPQLKNETLRTIEPFVQHGIREAQHTSLPHALREVAATTYLIGRGYAPRMAHHIVESWEVNEKFY